VVIIIVRNRDNCLVCWCTTLNFCLNRYRSKDGFSYQARFRQVCCFKGYFYLRFAISRFGHHRHQLQLCSCIYDNTKHLTPFGRIYTNRMKGIVSSASTFDTPYYTSYVRLLQILYRDLLMQSVLVFFYLPDLVNSIILTLISSPLILAVAAALFNCSTVNAAVDPF
jgi:hypothetical protein